MMTAHGRSPGRPDTTSASALGPPVEEPMISSRSGSRPGAGDADSAWPPPIADALSGNRPVPDAGWLRLASPGRVGVPATPGAAGALGAVPSSGRRTRAFE